jgi:hypothetical protein
MTRNEFTALCSELTIDPAIAVENEAVRAALIRGADSAELRSILNENF